MFSEQLVTITAYEDGNGVKSQVAVAGAVAVTTWRWVRWLARKPILRVKGVLRQRIRLPDACSIEVFKSNGTARDQAVGENA
jgi:hypothetical protein